MKSGSMHPQMGLENSNNCCCCCYYYSLAKVEPGGVLSGNFLITAGLKRQDLSSGMQRIKVSRCPPKRFSALWVALGPPSKTEPKEKKSSQKDLFLPVQIMYKLTRYSLEARK